MLGRNDTDCRAPLLRAIQFSPVGCDSSPGHRFRIWRNWQSMTSHSPGVSPEITGWGVVVGTPVQGRDYRWRSDSLRWGCSTLRRCPDGVKGRHSRDAAATGLLGQPKPARPGSPWCADDVHRPPGDRSRHCGLHLARRLGGGSGCRLLGNARCPGLGEGWGNRPEHAGGAAAGREIPTGTVDAELARQTGRVRRWAGNRQYEESR